MNTIRKNTESDMSYDAWLVKNREKIHRIAENVFCKNFFLKVASNFSIVLQLHFPQCCKLYFPVINREIQELQTFVT